MKNSAAAVELYCAAFGLNLGYNVKNADGSFYHSELNRGDEEIIDVVEASVTAPKHNIVQIGIILDSVDEVRKAFELLRDGGTVNMPLEPLPWSPCAASVTDRFGVWWYVSAPQHRPDDSFDPTEPINL